MNTLLKSFGVIALLLTQANYVQAYCGVVINEENELTDFIGREELYHALEKRGYYPRNEDSNDIELRLDIKRRWSQICYYNHTSKFAMFFNNLIEPPASIEMKAFFPLTGETIDLERKMPLYERNGALPRRMIKHLIHKLPKCYEKKN